ncbi:DHH family phosphoesterase [archaeon]|jgi:single-stranded-DNA-specific exonuclease|nr:DHH family phosphoesterase [archaeon]MBT4647790.1 DHH family phosphoesterase [archaeon]MBT6821651.1 DHH family phosphoesterase [archaeon]MBT7391821.1 DHH family phosphoesterase [archaeon]
MKPELDIALEKGIEFLKSIDKKEIIRLISHLDSDGICAAAIMVSALKKEDRRFKLSILNQLGDNELDILSKEDQKYYIFTDLGSGQLKNISQKLPDKKILILDHHAFDENSLQILNNSNIVHINPKLYGYNCNEEISGSGVAYIFSKKINQTNIDMSHIAIIGAIGDSQEKKGFLGLNNDMLEDAIKSNLISLEKGIRWFGIETKSLVKLMSNSTDLKIPGVNGSEDRSYNFLKQIGIAPRGKVTWKKYSDLTDEEKEKLKKAIIEKRKDEKTPEDILGVRYILVNQENSSPTKDAKEFSTLLNACGRLGHYAIGVGACLNDSKSKEEAYEVLKEYRRKITEGMNWYEENKFNEKKILLKDGYIIINAKDEIIPTIIGTLSSIVSYSGYFQKKTFILSMARIIEKNKTKISLRCSKRDDGADLRSIISEIMKTVNGESGGHVNAAGGTILTSVEEDFIENADRILQKHVMIETIV